MNGSSVGTPLVSETTIALPASFFTELLPAIRDAGELRVMLAIYYRIAQGARLVTESELLSEPAVVAGLVPLGSVRDPAAMVRAALELALTRGSLIAVQPADLTDERRWYTLNTPAGRELVAALEAGEVTLVESAESNGVEALVAEQPNVFRLYERHIAVLTPLVAQQLAEAVSEYPTDWIVDAFAEAVARDRRSWRFVRHLLDRWVSEGRDHAPYRRHLAQSLDPNKYTKGKYAAIFQR